MQDKIEQRNQELDWDMHILWMRFHCLPTARVIPVVPTFGSPKLPQRRRHQTGIWKDEGMPRGQCSHGLRANITHTFTRQWPARCVLWYSVSMSSASMVCLLTTYKIWTDICCAHHRLRAYAWWLHTCTLKAMHIKPFAGCLSCEHSFPPPACRSCLQPSLFTYFH